MPSTGTRAGEVKGERGRERRQCLLENNIDSPEGEEGEPDGQEAGEVVAVEEGNGRPEDTLRATNVILELGEVLVHLLSDAGAQVLVEGDDVREHLRAGWLEQLSGAATRFAMRLSAPVT